MIYTVKNVVTESNHIIYNDGISHGIQGIINLCKLHNLGMISAKETIMREYSLTESETDEYINLYW